jgi:putative redox protein
VSDVGVGVEWVGGLRFEARGRSPNAFVVDGDSSAGPSPVETLLIGLASCMGADVVEILTKMRVPLSGLAVRAEGDRRSEPPRRYTAIRLIYETAGLPESEQGKLERAVELSRDRYCSVLHTLQPDLDVAIRIETG